MSCLWQLGCNRGSSRGLQGSAQPLLFWMLLLLLLFPMLLQERHWFRLHCNCSSQGVYASGLHRQQSWSGSCDRSRGWCCHVRVGTLATGGAFPHCHSISLRSKTGSQLQCAARSHWLCTSRQRIACTDRHNYIVIHSQKLPMIDFGSAHPFTVK